MHIWSALLAIIVTVVKLILRVKAHTQAMLPDLTRLALDHEFTSIRVVLSFQRLDCMVIDIFSRKHTSATTDTTRNSLLFLVFYRWAFGGYHLWS